MAERPDDRTDVPVQDLAAFVADPSIRGASGFTILLWWFVQGTLFACSPQFMYGWRRWLLRCFGCKVGSRAAVRSSAKIQYPWKVAIGRNAQIGDEVVLSSTGPIVIGDNVVISQRAFICAGTHDISTCRFQTLAVPITIDSEAWICAQAFIYPGVHVGRGAIVAAAAVLRDDIPPYQIFAGSPAVCVGDRRDKLRRHDVTAATIQ